LRTTECGMANAWYQRPTVTICYEYLNDIRKSIPAETTPQGITPTDAVLGQFFYVVAHEMGHAMFDMLNVPLWGRAEDAADQFATYIMLQFGMAYCADRETLGDLVTNGYLPQARARNCRVEFGEANFAFQQTLRPSVDRDVAKKVLEGAWLPDVLEHPDLPPPVPQAPK
jgi:hypothetical protein